MMDAREKGFRIGGGNLEMFGRDSIDHSAAESSDGTTITAPWSFQARAAISRRGKSASWRSTSPATVSPKAASSVIKMDWDEASCSA
jgi:hypothetical protein